MKTRFVASLVSLVSGCFVPEVTTELCEAPPSPPQPAPVSEEIECRDISYEEKQARCNALAQGLVIGSPQTHPSRTQLMEWYGEIAFKRDVHNRKRRRFGRAPLKKNYKGIPIIDEPLEHSVEATLMKYPFRVHEDIAPLFECIELDISTHCTDAYEIKGPQEGCNYSQENCLSHAFRGQNPYRHYLSCHVFGICIDINPGTNQMSTQPTTDIPECWIDVFEDYGFLWGGSDEWVQRENKNSGKYDPMHFQFVCNPHDISRIIHDHQMSYSEPYCSQ